MYPALKPIENGVPPSRINLPLQPPTILCDLLCSPGNFYASFAAIRKNLLGLSGALSRGNPFGWNSPAKFATEGVAQPRNIEFHRDNDKWKRSSLRFNINPSRLVAYYRSLGNF